MTGKRDALDLKIVEFSWAVAGPLIVKYLADHGATVVLIESPKRLGLTRSVSPHKDGKRDPDRAGYFAHYNPNRYSMALDLGHPKGIEVARRLAAWADVATENFSPGTMEKWGLGYQDLKKIKENIIMVRTSAQGQTGPFRDFRSLGVPLSGLAGFAHYLGWPDQLPLAPSHAYSDVLSPRLGVIAVLAALDYRRRTGKGQCVDISMVETSTPFLAHMVLDYVMNGREGVRVGNAVPSACPHAVYRCQGDDRWCGVAVSSDSEWSAFCELLGSPPWTREPRFATLLGRKQNEDELNPLVEEWTVKFTPEEVMAAMQKVGVAAGVVETPKDVAEDPQLQARGHFWTLKHPVLGEFLHLGEPFRLSKTPARGRMPAPRLGEHTKLVCNEFLGMSESEFADLFHAGAFGLPADFYQTGEVS